MRQERHAGYEVKALSNLIRRKVWELSGQPECDAFTEMQGMLLGFLCHNRDQEIFQKDLEEAFYIRRSTASRLLKRLEEEGFVMRCSVSRDARLKQVMATPKAEALNQQIASRITQNPRCVRCLLSLRTGSSVFRRRCRLRSALRCRLPVSVPGR